MVTRRTVFIHSALAAVIVSLSACTGSSGGGGTTLSSAIEVPGKVDVVSAKAGSSASRATNAPARCGRHVNYMTHIKSLLRSASAVSDLPADSDYNETQTRKFIEIRALEVFEILDSIFSAFSQTKYEDNIGTGCYVAKVKWTDECEGGAECSQIQNWTVQTQAADVNGDGNADDQTVHLFIEEIDPETGEVEPIKVFCELQQAPEQNEDGSLENLGIWRLTAIFGQANSVADIDDYFFAESTLLGDGTNKLVIRDQFTEEDQGQEFDAGTRALIYRDPGGAGGRGQIEMPDWEACFGPQNNCPPPPVEINFEYDTEYLCVRSPSRGTECFDRDQEIELVHRYKLFDCTTGADVEKAKSFGFPIIVNEGQDTRFGWYGAWQDRHELWVNGDPLADGTNVVQEDFSGQGNPTPYTVDKFPGALEKVTLVTGSVDQLEGIAAEVWLFSDRRIKWDGAKWDECPQHDCTGGSGALTDFTAELPNLEYAGADDPREIWIEKDGTNYVYVTDSNDPSVDGFYPAQQAQQNPESCGGPPQWEANGPKYSPANDDELFLGTGGRTYIMYTGEFDSGDNQGADVTDTGWVEKTLADFDCQTWTPEFDDNADREFPFDLGREYFVNNRGANLRVTRTATNGDADDFSVFMDTVELVKPSADLDAVMPDGTILVDPFNPAGSTYVVNKDANDSDYLMLTYATLGPDDQDKTVGDVVMDDWWGLRNQVDGSGSLAPGDTVYNWTYQDQGESWGGVTYLKDANGDYALLSEPVRLDPITLQNSQDVDLGNPGLAYQLTFDGHLHGLQDTWWELEKANFGGTAESISEILDKNVIIPNGTEVSDSDANACYFVKATDVGIFVVPVPGSTPGLPDVGDGSASDLLDLDAEVGTPNFLTVFGLTIPTGCELKYVEGLPVE